MQKTIWMYLSIFLLILPFPVFGAGNTDSGKPLPSPFDDLKRPLKTPLPDFVTQKNPAGRYQTKNWAIHLSPEAEPGRLARELGAINQGKVAYLDNVYLFRFPEADGIAGRKRVRLKMGRIRQITGFQHQVARWRYPRNADLGIVFSDPLYPDQWHLHNTGQTGYFSGVDANVTPVWNEGITGEGVTIGIVDDGVQYEHPDIAEHYVPDLSYDFFNDDANPIAFVVSNFHGTAVTGVAAAVSNDTCGVGVAYNANIAAIRLIAGPTTDAMEAAALSYKRDEIDIYNNSWGPVDGYFFLEKMGPLTKTAMEGNIREGRKGLGSIYVWAAGNGLEYFDNVNYDSYANSRYTIAVSAVNHKGIQSNYSEKGAPILVAAPSSGEELGITTTDLQGDHGYTTEDCTSNFGGTSSAAPVVSGVVALMLQANPSLTWRDVQHILVKSAVQNDRGDPDWTANGAGLMVNHKYGYGLIDAKNAVDLAGNWQNTGEAVELVFNPSVVNEPIPDDDATGLEFTVDVAQDIRLEHVELVLDAEHSYRGDLEIILTSPAGTKSVMAELNNDSRDNYYEWKFMSVHHWDESSLGTWKLRVADIFRSDLGTLFSWQLIFHGTNPSGNEPPIALNDKIRTDVDVPVDIPVLENDNDPDGEPLNVVSTKPPQNGRIVINADNTITYTPDPGFSGTDEFVYTVGDGTYNGQGLVSITVGEKCLVRFDSSDTPLNIPDGNDSGVVSEIDVPVGGVITDVNVRLNVTHNYVSDLKGYLISPDGINIELFSRVGGSGDNFEDTVFDDEAVYGIINGGSPFMDDFRPKDRLKKLDGYEMGGDWKLKIKDISDLDTGVLESWSVEFCYMQPSKNRAPLARDDEKFVIMNTPVAQVDVLDNDTDANGDSLKPVSVTDPPNGTAYIARDNTIFYYPDLCYFGEDRFEYTISDGRGETSTAKVTVHVENNVIHDGGFETGRASSYWKEDSVIWGSNINSIMEYVHSGKWFCVFAGGQYGPEIASVYQDTLIPASGSSFLEFWLKIFEEDAVGAFTASVDGKTIFTATEKEAADYADWTKITLDISEFADNDSHILAFESFIKVHEEGNTVFFLDDISISIDCAGERPLVLRDAVLVLKLLAGMESGNIHYYSDIDTDSDIDFTDAFIIMQKLAQLR